MNDIPRYKSSPTLQIKFVTNADGTGDQVFEQIERNGNVAVYKRTKIENNKVFGYEVIVVNVIKAGTVFAKGSKPTETDCESYPGKASFGKTAWFYPTSKLAFKKFDKIVVGS